MRAAVAAFALLAVQVDADCPFGGAASAQRRLGGRGTPVAPHALPASYYERRKMETTEVTTDSADDEQEYRTALQNLDLDAVATDLEALFTDSQDWWPADYGNYGPFFIRLAWHCSGSYRVSDGRGGCAGGRQRYEPELSWDDNTNLDKARALLQPIKLKYGKGLSWGDLFILAGTTAIKSMGGPSLGFCAGRQDDSNGFESEALGATPYQEIIAPCEVNGNCTVPVAGGTELGSTTVGLIYVNPEGFMAIPDPTGSINDIRTTFGRMAMNDTETVALIGGGHAFGKTHGACPLGAGPNPQEQPENPWPGLCGTGMGDDTYTSGFEGPWTATPTTWNNEYFKNLLNYNWSKVVGPGGHWQWNASGTIPAPDGESIMMLTSDQALITDPDYKVIVERFANDLEDFTYQFSHAWYKLTTRDMGPWTRCMGDDVPDPQPFQMPLPPAPSPLADFDDVAQSIRDMLTVSNDAVLPLDGTGSYGPLFVRLAWQCANTFRGTDYQGGCNGARIRFEPESSWTNNGYLDKALDLLQSVKDKYGDSLSWADLIVLAGNVGLSDAAGSVDLFLPFTGGRSDALSTSEPTPDYLESRLTGGRDLNEGTVGTIDIMRDTALVMGLTDREYVALVGGGHSLGQTHSDRSGFVSGQWTTSPAVLDTEFFENLVTLQYTSVPDTDSTHLQWTTTKDGQTLYMLNTDMNLFWDANYRSIAQEYAEDGGADAFYTDFASAWTKVMNADMFGIDSTDEGDDVESWELWQIAVLSAGTFVGGVVMAAIIVAVVCKNQKGKGRSLSYSTKPTTMMEESGVAMSKARFVGH